MMDIKGMKRFENFLRREQERREWEEVANEEDIEFVRCQEELQEQLLAQCTQVERVIGEGGGEGGGEERKWCHRSLLTVPSL